MKEAVRDLSKHKDKHNPSMRLMTVKLKKLNDAKDELLEKHFTYAEKSGKDVDSEELKDWLNPQIDAAIDLADEVFIIIDEYEENVSVTRVAEENNLAEAEANQKKRNESVILEKQCESTEKLIKDTIEVMLVIVNDDTKNTIEDKDLVTAHLKEIDGFLATQTKSWNELMISFVDDVHKLAEICEREQTLKQYVSERRLLAFTFVEAGKEKHTPEKNDTTRSDPSLIHLQKIKPPTFSGNIRTFANFKSAFKNIVEPRYPDKLYQAYILKENCLSGEAKSIIENIVDVDKIWERLQDKYGNHLEIVNIIVEDLQKLSLKNTDQGFVHLVDTLEKAVQDLEIIGAIDEITNAHTVNLLERKLPKRILSKWRRKIRSTMMTGKLGFRNFLHL